MGVIAASSNIPSAKFQFPTNLAEIEPNSAFTIKIAFKHLETGHFTNAQQTYYAAPQVVNDAGDIRGHSHVVVEKLNSLTQTEPTNPNNFAFFKGLNDGGNVLTADVSGGLPEGVYRLSSINTAANHQPCLVAVAQHGSIDDAVYVSGPDKLNFLFTYSLINDALDSSLSRRVPRRGERRIDRLVLFISVHHDLVLPSYCTV